MNEAVVFGLVVSAVLVFQVVAASRSGSLDSAVLGEGSPWPAIAVIGVVLVVAAAGAPRSARVISGAASGSFLFASVDPAAPDPSATMLPYLALAAVCGVAGLAAHFALQRAPHPARPTTSSQELRRAVRAHQTAHASG